MLLQNLILSRRYQARLKPLSRTYSYVRVHDKFLFSSFLFILDLVCLILPHLKDNPLRFLVLSLIYNIDLQHCNSISPFPDAPRLLYAPLFYGSHSSILHHISASTFHILFYIDLNNYSAKSLAQRSFVNNQFSSLRTQNKKNTYHKELASFLLHITSYSYLLPSILQTFFNAVAPSTIHCSTQLLSSITHKQTRSSTHAFLVVEIE